MINEVRTEEFDWAAKPIEPRNGEFIYMTPADDGKTILSVYHEPVTAFVMPRCRLGWSCDIIARAHTSGISVEAYTEDTNIELAPGTEGDTWPAVRLVKSGPNTVEVHELKLL